MPITGPFPSLEELTRLLGDTGRRLADIEASEGAAGNISVYMDWDIDPTVLFPNSETIAMPFPAPDLEGKGFLVTGSGRRLREIIDAPQANLGFLRVEKGGETAKLYTSPDRLFARLTTEFNSHLAIHRDQIAQGVGNFHAIVHAQPVHIVYLSHISRYQDESYFNRHLLRWQPESIVNIYDGVGVLPFILPGSDELMAATNAKMRGHRVVLWGKHGLIVRSDSSIKKACDLIEYVETGARYEYMNLANSGIADGLKAHEIQAICTANNVKQTIF